MLNFSPISQVILKSTASERHSKLMDENVHDFVNKLAFFYLIIGNFRSFFVSELIVITIKTGPRFIASKSEVMGKGLISCSIGRRGVS